MFKSGAFYAAFYWGRRKETYGECATRLRTFLRSLGVLDSIFDKWHEYSGSFTRPPARLRTSQKALEELVAKRWMRKDVGQLLVPHGGCTLVVSNDPSSRDSVSINIGCGADSNALTNACLIYLPARGDARKRLFNVEQLPRLVEACVVSWEPLNGLITSDLLTEAIYSGSRVPDPVRSTRVGWLTYLSAKEYEEPTGICSPSSVAQVADLGYVITAMDAPPDSTNASHLAILRKIANRVQKKRSIRQQNQPILDEHGQHSG